MAARTRISNADWVVAWDAANARHAYLAGGDVVFEGDTIAFVGRGDDGPADTTIDGRGLMVMPGLVNVHAHPATEPFFRGIREEHGVPAMYMSGLYERSVAYFPPPEARRFAAEAAYCELLKSGVTTVLDLSAAYPGWLDLAARSGLRVMLAPGYASARWKLENDWRLLYEWDEAGGRKRFDDALRLIDEAARHPCGRLTGALCPTQIDTCSEGLLRDSAAAARARGLALTTHCAQSVVEFNEMVARHGMTPVQWAAQVGVLGRGTILGHAIFLDGHSWLHWHSRDDLRLLAETGTAVGHCPTVFARYGQALEDIGAYRRAGVAVGLGTDVAPHNLIEEMRHAIMVGRVAAGEIASVSTAAVFDAATARGADALLRPDLGRLAQGAKADLVLIDLTEPTMMPARDPLRSLVYAAADRAVRDVYVGGEKVVDSGRVLTLDHAGAAAALREAQARMEAEVPSRDFRGRTADDITPLSLPRL